MTFSEFIDIFMALPWEAQVLVFSPLVSIPLIFWLRPNLKDPQDHFYYMFTKKLDSDLRRVFWDMPNTKDARVRRENIIRNAMRDLQDKTGTPTNLINMSPIHRSAWSYLFKRAKEVLG